MKKLFFLINAILFTQTAFSQDNAVDILLKNEKKAYALMGIYIDSLFMNGGLANKCQYGISTVRFVVNKSGKPIDIQTNEGTPAFLDTVLRQALLRTKGLWNPGKTSKKVYILPVLYSLNRGCKIDTSSKKLSPLEITLKNLPDIDKPDKEGYSYGCLNMLNFKKTKETALIKMYPPLECLLLTPFDLSPHFWH